MAERNDWYKLDNAAKIIPTSVEGADTRVFRLVCELKEPVDPAILQQALDKTLLEFPYLCSCLRRGVFWYYMDAVDQKPLVRPDNKHALASLYRPGRKNLLFRVTYYEKRINVEMFHVLADGTGGFVFMTHLVAQYLSLKYDLDYDALLPDSSSVEEKESDAFGRFYEDRAAQKKNNRTKEHRNFIKEMFPEEAYQIKGERDADLRQHLIEAAVPTDKLVAAAKAHGVTVGVFTTSLYIEALLAQMTVQDRKRPIVISVPVNLRQFFPSSTTRNFFGTIQISYHPDHYDGSLESILKDVQEKFARELDPERVFQTMNSYAALEHNYAVKMSPLFLKWPALHGFNSLMKKGVTTSVSNIGRINVPDEIVPYVDRYSAFMSGRNAFMCVSTFREKTIFGVASCFTRHTVFMTMFRRMEQMGIPVEIATNDYDKEAV